MTLDRVLEVAYDLVGPFSVLVLFFIFIRGISQEWGVLLR